MKIGVHIPCYRLTHFLPAVIKNMAWADRILVTNSIRPWDDLSGNPYVDKTVDICTSMNMDNLEIVQGNWLQDSEHLQRNMAMRVLSDCDLIFLVDSDEIIFREEQKELIKYALKHPEHDGFAVNTIPYFGDLEHVALYDEGNTPLALVRPNCKFFVTRCIENPWIYLKDFNIHHLKFLQPIEQIGWRVNAKHDDQKRAFNGVKPYPKNEQLYSLMEQLGYPNPQGELKEVTSA